MKVTETRDASALSALRPEWDMLVGRAERATIYQTWDWNEAWWQTHRTRKQLRLLMVRDGNDLIGLAPLYTSHHLGTPLRRIAFLGTGVSDYLDIIAPDSDASRVCTAICAHLAATRSYDIVDLQQLAPSSLFETHAAARPVAGLNGHRVAVRPQEICPYLDLPETWDAFAAGLGKKLRTNLSYYDRLLTRTHSDAEIVLCRTEDLTDAMAALFDLHGRRWRMRMMPGVLSTKAKQRFHDRVAARFQEQGWLRLHLIRTGNVIVGALYCFRFRSRYYYYLGGFEPEMAKLSLGTTLTACAIRQAISEGCKEFDFLRGAEAYKYRWKPQERRNSQCVIARPASLRGGAMFGLARLERYVEGRAKLLSEKHSSRIASRGKGGSAA